MCTDGKPLRLFMLPVLKDLPSVRPVPGSHRSRMCQGLSARARLVRYGWRQVRLQCLMLVMCAGEEAASREHEAAQGACSSQV